MGPHSPCRAAAGTVPALALLVLNLLVNVTAVQVGTSDAHDVAVRQDLCAFVDPVPAWGDVDVWLVASAASWGTAELDQGVGGKAAFVLDRLPGMPATNRRDPALLAERIARRQQSLKVNVHSCRWTLVLHRPVICNLAMLTRRLVDALDDTLALELVPPEEATSSGDDVQPPAFRVLSRGFVEAAGHRNALLEWHHSFFNPYAGRPRAHREMFATEREVLLGSAAEDTFRMALTANERACVLALEVPDVNKVRGLWGEIAAAGSMFSNMGCWVEAYRLPPLVASGLRAHALQAHMHAGTVDELLMSADTAEALLLPASAARHDLQHRLCVFSLLTHGRSYLRQAEVAAETWAREADTLRDVAVFFVVPPGVEASDLHPSVARLAIRISGDFDVSYRHQAVRDLRTWHYFATHPTRPRCDWVARVDLDTWVNLGRLRERLSCFKPWLAHHVGWPAFAEPKLGGLKTGHSSLYLLNGVVLNRRLLSRMAAQQGFLRCLGALVHDWLGQGLMDETLSECIFTVVRVWPEFLGDHTEIIQWATGPPLEPTASSCVLFAHPAPVELMRRLRDDKLEPMLGSWLVDFGNGSSLTMVIGPSGLARLATLGQGGQRVRTAAVHLAAGEDATNDDGGYSHRLLGHYPSDEVGLLRLEGRKPSIAAATLRVKLRAGVFTDAWTEGLAVRMSPEASLTAAGGAAASASIKGCRRLLPSDSRLQPWCVQNHSIEAPVTVQAGQRIQDSCWSMRGALVIDRSWCCHELFGPRGNPSCWYAGYTYARCCLGRRDISSLAAR